jgi:hypothetical protein
MRPFPISILRIGLPDLKLLHLLKMLPKTVPVKLSQPIRLNRLHRLTPPQLPGLLRHNPSNLLNRPQLPLAQMFPW